MENMSSPAESLKSLRFLHQLLMLVTAGIFILALTPDPSRDYNAAFNELTALKTVTGQTEDYGTYLHTRVSPQVSDEGRGFLSDLVHAAGARMGNVKMPSPIVSDWTIRENTLKYYNSFFSSDTHTLARLEPHFAASFRNQWVDYLKHYLASQDPGDPSPILYDVRLMIGSQLRNGVIIQNWEDMPHTGQLHTSLTLLFMGSHNPNLEINGGPVAVTYS